MSTKTNKNLIDIISPEQCRAARGFLNWSQEELAEKVRVGKTAIGDFEREKTIPYKKTLEDIKKAFEDAGIELVNGGNGQSVKLLDGKK